MMMMMMLPRPSRYVVVKYGQCVSAVSESVV